MKIVAMILAAGLGSRLKPITDRLPKPLIKIGRETIIEKHLRNLKKANITNVVINVSHLAEKIIKEIGDGSDYGLKIIYSHERNRPLETLGGILNALELFRDADHLLVINSDVWCDYNFQHISLPKYGNKAHLILVPNKNKENPEGDFGINKNKINVSSKIKYTYSGLSCIELNSLKNLTVSYNKLGQLYRDWATTGSLSGEVYHGDWIDVGTHDRLKEVRSLIKKRS